MIATWIAFGAATLVAVLALVWPALAGARPHAPRLAHDAALYRAQLAELGRERAEGRLTEAEHRDAVLEVQRRLLAAGEGGSGPAPEPGKPAGRWLLLAAALALPSLALLLYLPRGTPSMPAFPHAEVAAERAAEAAETGALIARVRERIATLPPTSDDARRGWVLLAGAERNRGNFPAAIDAYRRALGIRFEPALAGDLVEALSLAAGGSVTDEAMALLRRAVAADPADPRTRYYLAIGSLERGDAAAALEGFRAVLAAMPADAPVRAMIGERIAEAENRLRAGQAEAAAALPPEQRQRMIASMVDGLAERLGNEPDDAEGWLRLAHAYRVLGRAAEARGALDRAAALLPGDPRVAAERAALERGG